MTEMATKQALELLDKQIDAAKVDLENTTAQWRAVEDRDTPEVVAKESAELQTWEERHRALLRGFLNLGYKQDVVGSQGPEYFMPKNKESDQ